jgi:hypothetical protein
MFVMRAAYALAGESLAGRHGHGFSAIERQRVRRRQDPFQPLLVELAPVEGYSSPT